MITGPNGFLYNQLTIEDSDDLLFLLGAPTTDNKVMLDEYVQTTKDIIRSNRHKYTVFASTAWIEQSDDYYNKSKKELELFIEENCSKYLILKIAEILDELNLEQAVYVIKLLDSERTSDILMELDEDNREKVLKNLF